MEKLRLWFEPRPSPSGLGLSLSKPFAPDLFWVSEAAADLFWFRFFPPLPPRLLLLPLSLSEETLVAGDSLEKVFTGWALGSDGKPTGA